MPSSMGGGYRLKHPLGRVPSDYGDDGDQLYLDPSNFCNWLSFFAGHCAREAKLTVQTIDYTHLLT